MSETDRSTGEKPGHGVVVRAPNGDVIRYDPSGLVMRLSDRVIEDIALRLGTVPAAAGPAPAAPPVDDAALDGVDAWDIRAEGDWLRFSARMPGRQGARGFCRHRDGGTILGDGPAPVLGLLALGGPSAALATPGAPVYPHHVVAPADDIGAVGMAGIEAAPETDRLEALRECTHEALVAETLLDWRMEAFAPLPLFVTRAETEAAPTAADLSAGRAIENLRIAARNLRAAATLMGRRAKIAAVCLDYALEDLSDSATAYRDGMLACMKAVERALAAEGFDNPLFVRRFENGLPGNAPKAALDGQWELSWNHGEHRLVHSAPGYMFALDGYDRPTDGARRQMAEMTAAAIAASAAKDGTWRCPVLHLAEREPGKGDTIRVIAQAEGDLVLDPADPLGAGPAFGFRLSGDETGAAITGVMIAPDDPRAILVQCDRPPGGKALHLAYAVTREDDGDRATGALRDDWALQSATGVMLRRWALPAHLPVTGGRLGR
ncbi:hypothetical protein N8I71_12710 [Roseibacterium sp. SDUM158016]|uniref:hypothetical protein n=1 Tax=Roseicyclus sediminis TaxID=2980997 RepID=UPI0021D00FF6|nr:hypothetical protein [Roseibacterium sp. SDUM158016]MCU4653698.1 hypothetical protein [Roseibacterium sp. SDUM158016]